MLDRVRKHVTAATLSHWQVTAPDLSLKVLVSAATLASFGWLLAHDLVQPIVIYAVQLYLAF
jgi:hypothetical protein